MICRFLDWLLRKWCKVPSIPLERPTAEDYATKRNILRKINESRKH